MQFKNLSIILAFVYFASTTLSAPISEEAIEASPIPTKSDKQIPSDIFNDSAFHKRENPYIEASPIPVKSDKEIPSDIFNDSAFQKRENPYIEASPIPVKSDKEIPSDILNDTTFQKRDNEKNPIY